MKKGNKKRKDKDIEDNIINSATNSVQNAAEIRKLIDIAFIKENKFIDEINAICNKINVDQNQIITDIEKMRKRKEKKGN